MSTLKRSPLVAELATADEQGLTGYQFSGWFGLFAPAGTPREVIDRLATASLQAVGSANLNGRLMELGYVPTLLGPDAFGTFYRGEVAKWHRVVKEGRLPQID